VARHDDAERIATDGLADFVCGSSVTQFGGQLPVGFRLAVADVGEQIPNSSLARVAQQRDREVELFPPSGQIFTQLVGGALEHFIGSRLHLLSESISRGRVPMAPEIHACERVATGG
jgi:hypothetical protein